MTWEKNETNEWWERIEGNFRGLYAFSVVKKTHLYFQERVGPEQEWRNSKLLFTQILEGHQAVEAKNTLNPMFPVVSNVKIKEVRIADNEIHITAIVPLAVPTVTVTLDCLPRELPRQYNLKTDFSWPFDK